MTGHPNVAGRPSSSDPESRCVAGDGIAGRTSTCGCGRATTTRTSWALADDRRSRDAKMTVRVGHHLSAFGIRAVAVSVYVPLLLRILRLCALANEQPHRQRAFAADRDVSARLKFVPVRQRYHLLRALDATDDAVAFHAARGVDRIPTDRRPASVPRAHQRRQARRETNSNETAAPEGHGTDG